LFQFWEGDDGARGDGKESDKGKMQKKKKKQMHREEKEMCVRVFFP
jgi:hypothetical protein